MDYGIADLSIIPMRCDQSERSEMVSQVLFGELYEVLQMEEKWIYIRLLHDGYEGWIDRKMYLPVAGDWVETMQSSTLTSTKEIFNIVTRAYSYENKLIVLGSVLPQYDVESRTCMIGDALHAVEIAMKPELSLPLRERLIHYALMYYNAPYLWGGRTPYGIDCSGLTQMAYRLVGEQLPRDASQQAQIGETLSFLAETKPGDLVFFGDEKITHVGLVWQEGRVIHASGKVRIDKLDHQGIYNEELKKYTHNLVLIKRVITA
ncbi:MAG: NlpC/P60 family protein [Marinifilaceae bacterium]